MKHFFKINLLFVIFTIFNTTSTCGQEISSNILWNKKDNVAVSYATIKGLKKNVVSNEDGVFEYQETNEKITISSVGYENIETDFNFLKSTDTIFMKPFTIELDEIIVSKDGIYKQMLRTILTDYALEPHKESFFLRAVIRKNNELYKIVDLSGIVEKQALFDTSTKPMPKKNYKVQIENIRKIGIEDKSIDYRLFSFKEFFTNVIRIGLKRENFKISYETNLNHFYRKINLNPTDTENNLIKGHFILNENNTFNEAHIFYNNPNGTFDIVRGFKSRTIISNWKTNYERNLSTNKFQLSLANLTAKTEVYRKDGIDIFECNYFYYSSPLNNSETIKTNINLDKDMFDIEGVYNGEYWKNNEVLILTKEMQEFVNKVNLNGKNSDFRSKSNIK